MDKASLMDLLALNDKNNTNTEYYICGPEGLKNTVLDSLTEHGISGIRINIEHFTPSNGEPVGVQHTVKIKLADGQTHQLNVASNQTVLSVAKAKGIVIPYACGMGTCGTCKCKVDEGTIADIPDDIPGLITEEKAQGFTLACQCYPKSNITLSYTLN